MRISDKKIFSGGGMDSDSSPEAIAPSDYREAWNFRVSGTTEGEDGIGTNLESTEPIEGERADGLNKAIGCQAFETIRKGLAFIYNSQGLNQIIEIDADTNEETILFTNKTDSAGENILPLNPQYYINDIKLVGGQFYVFTDANMQPCYINRDRLIDGSYGTLTEDDFLLIKAQILVPPSATYNDDASRSVNLLSGNLFQFRNQVVYLDNEYSAFSTISKRPVPTSEGTPAIGTDVTKNNNLIVSTHIGSNRVDRVILAARIGNLDWFKIKEKKRSEILAITDTEVDIANQIYEAYDPSTGLYSFVFYNDGLYTNIDVLETDLLADTVPQKVESLEILNGNVLALGGLTEGYVRPNPDVNISVSTYQPNLGSAPPDLSEAMQVSLVRAPYTIGYKYDITITGQPKEGDVLPIYVKSNTDNSDKEGPYIFIVLPSEEDNRNAFALRISKEINKAVVAFTTSDSVTVRIYRLVQEGIVTKGTINYANATTGTNKSLSALKSNSSYQLALAHYDKWGRPFPIATNDNYVVKTQSYSQLKGLASLINWQILSTPPEGAVSAQWLLSKNTTHEATLFVVAKIVSDTEQFVTLNINSLKEFNDGNDASILSYDFVSGDRCTFHYFDGDTDREWFTLPSIDVEVIGFEIEVTTDTIPVTNYLLKVRRSSLLEVDDAEGKNILIEIYTPRKRIVVNEDGSTAQTATVFYEVGEQIDIVDGAYTTTIGEIREGDVFLKTRQLENAVTTTLESYEVESFHFSDFYISNFTSYGRPRSYYDVNEREEKKASIRYSDVFRFGSEVNGITRFYPERIYGEGDGEISSDFGWINKIRQRDNYLVCIQELKVWHIPVFTSIIEDQASQQQIAISDRILGQARGLQSGKFGMGGAKESYAESSNGTIYFIDANNSMPVRDGYDGIKVISGKMSKFFKRVLQQAKNDGKKIIAWFDEYNQEYVVAIEGSGDILTTITFDSDNWLTEDDYTVIPADLAEVTPPTKGSVSINTTTGKAIYTPDTDEIGSDNFTFSFLDGVTTVTKRACINIEAGVTSIYQFVFGDLIDKELSTVYESNSVLIDGNNIPVEASIVGGEFEINGDGVWHTTPQMVNATDSIKVRVTSSASGLTEVSATLTVGDKSDTFSVTTVGVASISAQVILTDIPVTNGPNPGETYNIGFGVMYADDDSLIVTGTAAAGSETIIINTEDINESRAINCYLDLALNPTIATIETDRIRLELWFNGVMLKSGEIEISNDFTIDNAAIDALATAWGNIDLSAGGLLQLIGYNYDTYSVTVYSESNLSCTIEIYDDTTGDLMFTSAVPATSTTGPSNFDVMPDSDTITVKLLGADFSTEAITFQRNGFSVTPSISGTTYTFTGFAKEDFELLINNGA